MGRRTVSVIEDGKREFSLVQSHGAGTSTNSLRLKQEETRLKFRTKTDLETELWIRALQYLMHGGYGFWYAWEIAEDECLDIPGLEDADAPKAKVRRRRPKQKTLKKDGTLKKKKKQQQQQQQQQDNNNNEELQQNDNDNDDVAVKKVSRHSVPGSSPRREIGLEDSESSGLGPDRVEIIASPRGRKEEEDFF